MFNNSKFIKILNFANWNSTLSKIEKNMKANVEVEIQKLPLSVFNEKEVYDLRSNQILENIIKNLSIYFWKKKKTKLI